MNGKVLAMAVLTGMALPPAAAALRPGDVVSGFTVRSVTELPEVKGRLVRMAYEKNGADLAWLDRDDDNMTFAIGFRTFPQDDTGVAHIIEHSVLCGSEKYPVKEPFVDLLKSSFATFLNAWTSADSTMYPVCSRNGADFLNLVDVYMDSVLHPLSVKDPFAFEQEGWHYELDTADGELRRNGVVYSEMKGAFANPERRLYHELRRLLRGHCSVSRQVVACQRDSDSKTDKGLSINSHQITPLSSNRFGILGFKASGDQLSTIIRIR